MGTHLKKGLATLALLAACGAAQADPLVFNAALSGAAESPPNASAAMGDVTVLFDIDNHYMTIAASFTDLEGLSGAAHIHCCTPVPGDGNAGVATMLPTFMGFPANETSGSYASFFDTSQESFWNPAFLTNNGGTTAGAEAALMAGLNAGAAYFNIHSSVYPSGEIRGFLAAPIPEPAQILMLLAGLPLLLLRKREN